MRTITEIGEELDCIVEQLAFISVVVSDEYEEVNARPSNAVLQSSITGVAQHLERVRDELEDIGRSSERRSPEAPAQIQRDCAKLCEAVKQAAERAAARGEQAALEFGYYILGK